MRGVHSVGGGRPTGRWVERPPEEAERGAVGGGAKRPPRLKALTVAQSEIEAQEITPAPLKQPRVYQAMDG